jgi:hypothetical protein
VWLELKQTGTLSSFDWYGALARECDRKVAAARLADSGENGRMRLSSGR